MIFGERMIEEIRWGRKTETRRKREPRMTPGRTYAVQPGRGQPQVTRIRCLELRSELLGEIDEESAVREGFPDRDAFLDYWAELHGKVNLDQRVCVIRFELAEFIDAKTRRKILDYEDPMLLYDEVPCPLHPGQEIVLEERLMSSGESLGALLTLNEREALERRNAGNELDHDAALIESALRKMNELGSARVRIPTAWIEILRIRKRKGGDLNAEYCFWDNREIYLQAGLPEPEHKTLVSVHHWTPEEEHGMTRSSTPVNRGGRALDAGRRLDNPITAEQRQEEAAERRRGEMASAHRAMSKLNAAIAELERDPEASKVIGSDLRSMRKRKEAMERKLERIAA